MITLDEYVGAWATSPDWTPTRQANAQKLLDMCDRLRVRMEADGVIFKVSPKTGTCVGGEHDGMGGFRPQNCTQGAVHSSHKEGLAVDNYDPDNAIDKWLVAHQEDLEYYEIYIEDPIFTPGWSHWSIQAPRSGKHIFIP